MKGARGHRRGGFTLVELLAVLAIVALLVSMARPLWELSVRRQQEVQLKAALRTLRAALDDHRRAWDAGQLQRGEGDTGWPASLRTLVDGVPSARDPQRRVYFLRRLPRDPFADATLPAEQTWALRSSGSPPDDPQPGDDVFDVASRSTRIGLDGSPHASW
ncbi:MAG: type II secretion system protein [Aquabacterium sp.]